MASHTVHLSSRVFLIGFLTLGIFAGEGGGGAILFMRGEDRVRSKTGRGSRFIRLGCLTSGERDRFLVL